MRKLVKVGGWVGLGCLILSGSAIARADIALDCTIRQVERAELEATAIGQPLHITEEGIVWVVGDADRMVRLRVSRGVVYDDVVWTKGSRTARFYRSGQISFQADRPYPKLVISECVRVKDQAASQKRGVKPAEMSEPASNAGSSGGAVPSPAGAR